VRACRIVGENRGILYDPEEGIRDLRKEQSLFQREGDAVVEVWKDQKLMTMISMILEAKMVNTERKDRKIKLEIKRSHFVVQCNKFMKGADRWVNTLVITHLEESCEVVRQVGVDEYYLLGYNAVQSVESQPTFRRNLLPPSSGSKNKPSKKPL
jgi:hypothetical protein